MTVNQNLLELRNAILAVVEAHVDLAIADEKGQEGYSRGLKYEALREAARQLDDALEFLGDA